MKEGLQDTRGRSLIVEDPAMTRQLPFEPPGVEEHRSEQSLLAEARSGRWTMERLEREYILEVLRENGGHRGRTADTLGIDRRTLYRKLKQYADESSGTGEGQGQRTRKAEEAPHDPPAAAPRAGNRPVLRAG